MQNSEMIGSSLFVSEYHVTLQDFYNKLINPHVRSVHDVKL